MSLDRDETRANFRYFTEIETRWTDQDSNGHINNAVFYVYFDTVIMRFLSIEAKLDLATAPVLAFTVENMCRFHRPLTYPSPIECGLRVAKLGTSSVRYEIGVFALGADEVAATAYVADVFVDRGSQTPTPIPGFVRDALATLVTLT